MDPVTHGLLGAAIGQAACGRSLGPRALGWGAVVAMAPDLDMLASGATPMAEWLWHRGPTHALVFVAVAGPAIGWVLGKRCPGRLVDWVGLCLLALLSHPVLDALTTYGTQLFWPFSRRRLALDAVAIVDPAYSMALAFALVLGVWRGVRGGVARVAAWTALVVSSAYLALGLAVNARAEAVARRQLAAEGVVAPRVAAYPTLLQLPLRRVVARSGDEVRVGWWSGLSRRPITWERFVAARGTLVDAARATREAGILEWFANGETAARIEESGAVVEFDDLRYGMPGWPRDGLWGVRVRLDAAGRPVGPGERFDRPLPASASRFLAQLFRMTLGVS